MFQKSVSFFALGLAISTAPAFAGVAVPVHTTYICSGDVRTAPGTAAVGFTTITVGVNLNNYGSAAARTPTIDRFNAVSVGGGLTTSANFKGSRGEANPAFDTKFGGGFYINRQHWSAPAVWETIQMQANPAGSVSPWTLQWQTAAGNLFAFACNAHGY